LSRISITSVQVSSNNDIVPDAANNLHFSVNVQSDRWLDSHYHNDHIWGNQAVPLDTDIISTLKTRDLIAARGTKEDEWYRQHAVQGLNEARLQFEHARDGDAKALAKYVVVYHEAIVDSIPTPQARMPNIVFQDMLEFKGPKRSARFITYGAGHTASDAFLYLPDDHILFLADLLFIGVHPYLADGDPKGLWQTTAHIKDLQADLLVPGHGPVGRPNDLDVMLQYINELQELVKRAILDGTPLEQVCVSPIPSAYRTWVFPSFYRENIQFLFQFYAAA
jgi:glyoxylase-like metal-dependent hydrolase (beta-lactamase superfamily II)